ncbi:MAG: cadherin-like beta sandwich domain-containing protein [Kangiellaceae bacterium]|nr:cadherin-like beta sandwich domain-containing protein [Kangiellaceae bacterium]
MKLLAMFNVSITLGILILATACGGGGGNDSPKVETSGRITGIELSMGLVQPEFNSTILSYTASLSYAAENIRIKPTFNGDGAIFVNGVEITSADASVAVSVPEGETIVEVSIQNGSDSTTYTLNVHRQSMEQFTQIAYIKASNSGDNSFGTSVALDGDTLVVGALSESSNASGINGDQLDTSLTNSGAVYVFVNENGEWQQQAYIKSSNPDIDDFFGGELAIDGDTLVVGADSEDSSVNTINGNQLDNNSEDAGAAYVFVREAGVWRQQAYLKASNSDADDRFGGSISISGDTIVVGAYNESSDATSINGDQNNNINERSGAVYIFTRSEEQWSQQAYLKASNNDSFDFFGVAVAIDESTLAVGAHKEDSNAFGIDGNQSSNAMRLSGAVYLFERVNNQWTQQNYVKASNPGEEDLFGRAIALEGNTLVVSAENESSNATGINGDQLNDDARWSGAVYVFVKEGSNWSQQAYIKASNTDNNDEFGSRALALKGNRLIVGARSEISRSSGVNGNQESNYTNSHSFSDSTFDGAAYLFERVGDNWQQISYFKASNTHEHMSFGGAVSISDEYIIVGAQNEQNPGIGINPNQNVFDSFDYSGATYVFPNN